MTTLEKIKAEIEQIADEEQKHDEKWAMGLRYAVKIIDKYAEQEPCDDAISRQKLLEDLYKRDYTKFTHRDFVALVQYQDTVQQEPKTGHWILKRTFPTKLYDEYLNEYKCSECYREIRCTESQLVNYPYCHCGARMVWTQESEGTNEEM